MDIVRDIDRETGTQRQRQTDRHTKTETDRQTNRDRHRETEKWGWNYTSSADQVVARVSSLRGYHSQMYIRRRNQLYLDIRR